MKAICFALTGFMLLAGCKTTRHTETAVISNDRAVAERIDTVVTRDTVKIVESSRDSVIVQTKGDTVIVDRWHVRYKEREAVSKAAEVKIVRDTVTKYVTKNTVTVTEKPKTGKLWRGIAVVAVIALAVLAVILRQNKKNSNK